MKTSKKYGNVYVNKYADSTAKKYLSKKLKASITASGDFGEVGTKQYRDRVKIYFGLGTLDKKALASIKDQQKKFRILSDYSEREREIYSGQYLRSKMDDARDNLKEIIEKFGTDDEDEIENILNRATSNPDKEFAILSAMWNRVNEYYTSAKENYYKTKGRRNVDLEKDMDDIMTGLRNVLDDFNV